MTSLPAILLNNTPVQLGRSRHNRNTFEPLEVFSHALDGRSSLVRRSSLVTPQSQLRPHCATYVLPRLFSECLKERQEAARGIYSGRRALYFPETHALDLQQLGWASEEAFQECVVEVKGAGILLNDSEHVTQKDVQAFMQKHRLQEREPLEDELVFSFNDYRGYETPEGAQHEGKAVTSMEASEYFLSTRRAAPVKVAPTLCITTYPATVQALAREFSHGDLVECKLAQEKRLMPSFVRGSYFEHNPGRNPELVRKIHPDSQQLKRLVPVMLEDMRAYFELMALTTEQKKGRAYQWVNVGYLDSVFDDPRQMLGKPYGWYLLKDIVVAPSGLYFVDLECVTLDRTAKSRKELRRQHGLYLTALFKDFFRLLTHYELAVAEEEEPSRMARLEETVREKLIDRLNASPHFQVDLGERHLSLRVKYGQVKAEQYRLDLQHLPRIVQ